MREGIEDWTDFELDSSDEFPQALLRNKALASVASVLPAVWLQTNWPTTAMITVGERIDWGSELVLDKHCVGGLPGNRTMPIVVAIVAASGFLVPKTSGRIVSTDTIPRPSNAISTARLFAQALQEFAG